MKSRYIVFVLLIMLPQLILGCESTTSALNSEGTESASVVQQNQEGNSAETSKSTSTSFSNTINLNEGDFSAGSLDTDAKYIGKGTVIKDAESDSLKFRWPYLTMSETGEPLLQMGYVFISPDSITQFGLKEGVFVDIEASCTTNSDNTVVFIFDSCQNTSASFLEDMYNRANLVTLPTKKDFDEFRRYGEEGTMCKLSVHVYSTDSDGYSCAIDYFGDDSGYLFLLDELNGKGHVRILPDDDITVLCRFNNIDSSGAVAFNLDYVLEVKGVEAEKPNSGTPASATANSEGSNNDTTYYDSSETEIGDWVNPYADYGYASDAEKNVATSGFIVVNSPNSAYANIRSNPDVNSTIKYTWENGRTLDYLGDSKDDGQRTWYHVGYYNWDGADVYYEEGWISSNVCEVY